jgi:hypothetical protein
LDFAKGTNADKRLNQHGAIAGSAFLQNFVVTFDYKNSVVVLERFEFRVREKDIECESAAEGCTRIVRAREFECFWLSVSC